MSTSLSFFKHFKDSPAGRRASGLLARHNTNMAEMFIVIWQEVSANLPLLTPGKRYTGAQLIGADAWVVWMFKGQKYAAGMCLSFIVKEAVFKLELHKTRSGKGTKRYYVPKSD